MKETDKIERIATIIDSALPNSIRIGGSALYPNGDTIYTLTGDHIRKHELKNAGDAMSAILGKPVTVENRRDDAGFPYSVLKVPGE